MRRFEKDCFSSQPTIWPNEWQLLLESREVRYYMDDGLLVSLKLNQQLKYKFKSFKKSNNKNYSSDLPPDISTKYPFSLYIPLKFRQEK